ncbi:type IV secretory system conjugative DNA transfer family protein [Spirosoma pomorum]
MSSDTLIGIHIGEGIHWNEKGHMLCVGGSGQGKGVNLVLPALLSEGLTAAGVSVVCLDPKGENAAVSAANLIARGYDVYVLNPFGIKEINNFGNSFWNPFNLIDPKSDNASKLYDVLAMSIHNRKGQGNNSFFDNRCRQYISLYLSYAHFIGQASFDTVYRWTTFSGDRRTELLYSMATAINFDGSDTAQAVLDRLVGEAAKTEENIYGTIEEAMNIFKDKALRRSLSISDFDMREIAKRPTAIFVCIPFEELGYYSAWVRMFFNFLLRTLTRHYDVNRKVLVLLDEFAQLSYMDEIVQSSTVLRGYNVTLWPIVQSLGQLKDIYNDKWEVFINTAVVKHWLSSGADNTTADYVSHRMPQAIKFIGNNADGSPKEILTKLLDPNQVMSFDSMICEISGLEKPIWFRKIPYWNNPFCRENASPNPFYN